MSSVATHTLSLILDQPTSDALDGVASELASKSAFRPSAGHGALRRQPARIDVLACQANEQIVQKIAGSTNLAVIQGRCVRWNITHDTLRVLVQFSLTAEAELQNLVAKLSGSPLPAPHYVALGSVADIDPLEHEIFLAAVEQGFPLSTESIFTCVQLSCVGPAFPLPAAAAPTDESTAAPTNQQATAAIKKEVSINALIRHSRNAICGASRRMTGATRRNNTSTAVTSAAHKPTAMDIAPISRVGVSKNSRNRRKKKTNVMQQQTTTMHVPGGVPSQKQNKKPWRRWPRSPSQPPPKGASPHRSWFNPSAMRR